MKGFPRIHLAFPSLNMAIVKRNSPLQGILGSFPKLQPNVAMLNEQEFRNLGRIRRTYQTEPQWLSCYVMDQQCPFNSRIYYLVMFNRIWKHPMPL